MLHVPPHRRAGRWHDFETCDGGGVIDLVARENGGDEAAAAYWLRHSGFLFLLAFGIEAFSCKLADQTPPLRQRAIHQLIGRL